MSEGGGSLQQDGTAIEKAAGSARITCLRHSQKVNVEKVWVWRK